MKCQRKFVTARSLAAAAAVLGLCVSSVQGFDGDVHRSILHAALPSLSPDVIADIEGNFFSGVGNVGSDLYPNEDYRHIDNAASPVGVCLSVDRAWVEFTSKILHYVREGDFRNARSYFGFLTHAVQDFY